MRNYSYKKLKLKIKEVYDTQEAFAEAMEMSQTSLNQRLNGLIDWRISEISTASTLLGIPMAEVAEYFFNQKVQESKPVEA